MGTHWREARKRLVGVREVSILLKNNYEPSRPTQPFLPVTLVNG